jgi:hypothetical protein
MFVARELSVDMDLNTYNRMLTAVVQNPKFAEFFPSPVATVGSAVTRGQF